MQTKSIVVNKAFVGREFECEKLESIASLSEASIAIVYGRRRIGKTELVEQVYRNRNILKFEGIENKPESVQRLVVLQQLADYTGDVLLRNLKVENWIDIFRYIHHYVKKGKWTVYFEELQWLADYNDNFISELKYYWDNYFRHNPELLIVLCGSSPSFMIKHVVFSKALYNRSQHELHLREFNLPETKQFLPKLSERSVMDAYLTVGGIPEYLKRLRISKSVRIDLCNNSFKQNAFFSQEYQRIFISSMAQNPNYHKIIEFLSKQHYATRDEIIQRLKLQSGGRMTELLEDLLLCGFIGKYTPYNLHDDSKTARYCIQDNYLQFYFKFIKPKQKAIEQGKFNNDPCSALNEESYYKWLGFAFERLCRRYSYVIARILGFDAVSYQAGAYFSRTTDKQQPGFQLDLVFDRRDDVMTVCEIKYLKTKVKSTIIEDFEKKLELLANTKQKTLHKVLICSYGVDATLEREHYFDRIITLDDLFNPIYW